MTNIDSGSLHSRSQRSSSIGYKLKHTSLSFCLETYLHRLPYIGILLGRCGRCGRCGVSWHRRNRRLYCIAARTQSHTLTKCPLQQEHT